MLPVIQGEILFDAKFDEAGPRVLNAAGKTALGEVLRTHHRRRIRQHFEATNREKYRHKPRTESTKRRKMARYRSRTDLVKSARTRDRMTTQYQIRIGGTVAGTSARSPGLTGTLILKFPFPASFDNSTNRVTLADMRDEIGRWTPEEEKEAAAQFAEIYAKEISRATAGKKRRPPKTT